MKSSTVRGLSDVLVTTPSSTDVEGSVSGLKVQSVLSSLDHVPFERQCLVM